MRQHQFPASAGNSENRVGTSSRNDPRHSDPRPRRNLLQEKPLLGAHISSLTPPASDIPLCMARTMSPRNSQPRACLYISPPVSDSPPNRSAEAHHLAWTRILP